MVVLGFGSDSHFALVVDADEAAVAAVPLFLALHRPPPPHPQLPLLVLVGLVLICMTGEPRSQKNTVEEPNQ